MIVVISVISSCAYGLTVDLSRLRQLRRPYILEKREGDGSCLGKSLRMRQSIWWLSRRFCFSDLRKEIRKYTYHYKPMFYYTVHKK